MIIIRANLTGDPHGSLPTGDDLHQLALPKGATLPSGALLPVTRVDPHPMAMTFTNWPYQVALHYQVVAPKYQVAPHYRRSIDPHQIAMAFTNKPYEVAPHYQVVAPNYQVAPHYR